MGVPTIVPTLVVMLVLLCCSAFFSAAETGLFNLRREDLRTLGRRRGRLVRRLLHDPRSLLITVLLGNLAINTLFYATAVMLALRLLRAGHVAAGAAIEITAPILVITVAELFPKVIAVRASRTVAVFAAPPLVLLRTLIWPVRVLLSGVTEAMVRLLVPHRGAQPYVTADELKQLLDASQARGTVRPEEGRILRELVNLGHLRCREVMVPRVDVVMCPVDAPPAQFIDLVRSSGQKHIPVYRGDPDRIVGVVDARMVLAQQPASLQECVRPIAFVPETKSVEGLLREFRQTHTPRAIVVDEYGGTAGLVTITDVIEEIVGEIGRPAPSPSPQPVHDVSPARGEGEGDRASRSPSPPVAGEGRGEGGGAPLVERVGVHTYRVSGRLSIHDWNDHPAFPVDLSRRGIDTIGGFVTALFRRVPRTGDTVQYRNLRFTVGPVVRRRIESVTVDVLRPRRNAPTGEPEGDRG